jgi:hypothetical protein
METKNSHQSNDVTQTSLTTRFIRTSDLLTLYGLKRSFVYQLIKDGRLPSLTVRGRGGARGIRLYRPEDVEKTILDISKEA